MRAGVEIKAFVPPILWSAIRTAVKGDRASAASRPRLDATALASEDCYSLEFQRVQLDGKTYFVPDYAVHRPASKAILSGALYEPETHRLAARWLRLRPGSIVHAGTFFGDMVPNFSAACPSYVYAFEPVLENFILAKLCVEANGLGNVVLLNSGLGSSICPAKIDTGVAGESHRGGASSISDAGQTTTLLTVDCFGIPDLSLLQLDVEGHELEVLKGARQTLARCAPLVLIEDNAKNCSSFLESEGYALAGEIPGLSVWTRADDAASVMEELRKIQH
jgi:FkbM family methyltransferase